MGVVTRAEYRSQIIDSLDNREDVAETDLNNWINRMYLHMTHPAVQEFVDTQVTTDLALVVGQASYPLTEAVLGFRVLQVRVVTFMDSASPTTTTRRRRLNPMPIEWYDNQTHPAGEPTRYVLGEGQTILFSLTPNAVRTARLRLVRQVDILDDDADVTVLPDYFDEALLLGAQALAEFHLGYRDRSNETLQLYNSYLSNATPKGALEIQNWGRQTPVTSHPLVQTS